MVSREWQFHIKSEAVYVNKYIQDCLDFSLDLYCRTQEAVETWNTIHKHRHTQSFIPDFILHTFFFLQTLNSCPELPEHINPCYWLALLGSIHIATWVMATMLVIIKSPICMIYYITIYIRQPAAIIAYIYIYIYTVYLSKPVHHLDKLSWDLGLRVFMQVTDPE